MAAVAPGWERAAAEVAFDNIFWSVLCHADVAPVSDGAEKVDCPAAFGNDDTQGPPQSENTSDERWPGSRPDSAWTLSDSSTSSTTGPAALELMELVMHTGIEGHLEMALADMGASAAGGAGAGAGDGAIEEAALQAAPGGEVTTMPPPLVDDGGGAAASGASEARCSDGGGLGGGAAGGDGEDDIEELRGRLQDSIFTRLDSGLLEQTLEHVFLGCGPELQLLPEAPEEILPGLGEDVEGLRCKLRDTLFAHSDAGLLEQRMEEALLRPEAATEPPAAAAPSAAPAPPEVRAEPRLMLAMRASEHGGSAAAMALQVLSASDRRIGLLTAQIREVQQRLVEREESCRQLEDTVVAAKQDLAHLELDIEWHRNAFCLAEVRGIELKACQRKTISDLDVRAVKPGLPDVETWPRTARSDVSTAATGVSVGSFGLSPSCVLTPRPTSGVVLEPIVPWR